jgi:hypothetical protein
VDGGGLWRVCIASHSVSERVLGSLGPERFHGVQDGDKIINTDEGGESVEGTEE